MRSDNDAGTHVSLRFFRKPALFSTGQIGRGGRERDYAENGCIWAPASVAETTLFRDARPVCSRGGFV